MQVEFINLFDIESTLSRWYLFLFLSLNNKKKKKKIRELYKTNKEIKTGQCDSNGCNAVSLD